MEGRFIFIEQFFMQRFCEVRPFAWPDIECRCCNFVEIGFVPLKPEALLQQINPATQLVFVGVNKTEEIAPRFEAAAPEGIQCLQRISASRFSRILGREYCVIQVHEDDTSHFLRKKMPTVQCTQERPARINEAMRCVIVGL